MGKGSIKGITIQIGGDTTGLDKALSATNKKSRALTSELKAVDKALKLDPNSLTLVKQKQDLLSESIKNTKDKLKTLEVAQSQVKKQFKNGEIDEGQYRAFQRELETTKKKLSSLKEEKKNIHVIKTAFKDAKEAVAPVTNKVKKVASGIGEVSSATGKATTKAAKFSVTLGKIDTAIIGKAADGFKAYTTAVAGSATAVAGLAVSQAANLDTIDKQSQALGLSRTAYQEWDYVLSQNGVDIESFGTGMKSLLSNMDKCNEGNATAQANFKKLGIAVTNSDGSLRNQEDVLKDTVAAFQHMEDGADKTRLATELFGKQGQALMPLLNGTAGSVDELMQKCNDLGMVVSDETVDAGVKFTDALDTLKRSAQGVFNTFASTGILESFTSGIELMTDGVSDLLSAYKEGGIDGLVEQIPETIDNLINTALKGITDKAPTLITATTTVLTSIIQSLAQHAPQLIKTLLPALLNGFFGLINAFVSAVPTLVPALIDGAITLFLGLIDGLNQVVEQLMPMLPDIITHITETLKENIPMLYEGGFQLLIGLIQGIADCAPQLIDSVIELIPVITDALVQNIPALIQAGMQLIMALAEGLPKAIPAIIEALPEIIGAIWDGLKEVDWIELGANILEGILLGLKAAVKGIWKVVKEVGADIVDGFKSFFGINSPSRLMAKQIGAFLPPGIGMGMEETADIPVKEAEDIVNKVAGVSTDIDPIMLNKQIQTNFLANNTSPITTIDFASTGGNPTMQLPQNAVFNLNINGQQFAQVTAPFLDAVFGGRMDLQSRGVTT